MKMFLALRYNRQIDGSVQNNSYLTINGRQKDRGDQSINKKGIRKTLTTRGIKIHLKHVVANV